MHAAAVIKMPANLRKSSLARIVTHPLSGVHAEKPSRVFVVLVVFLRQIWRTVAVLFLDTPAVGHG